MSELNNLLSPPEEKKEKPAFLTDEQKAKILESWNKTPESPPSVNELIEVAFGTKCDARSKEGRLVRQYLSSVGLKSHGESVYIKKPPIELTQEQKDYVQNHCVDMRPVELVRELFNKPDATNLDLESRAVVDYIKTLPSIGKHVNISAEEYEDYKPPKTTDHAIARINGYVSNANLERSKLTEKQKRDIKNLIGYLHCVRYIAQIETYSMASDRKLFESTFIRCTYNRELEEQEVDQYVMYATEVVSGKQIAKRIEQFEQQQDDTLNETSKVSMSIVEAVKTLRTDLHQCITRQRLLLKALEGERQKKMDSQKGDNTSILDLLSYWKDHQKRQHLVKLAEIREEKLKDEIERLKNLDELKIEIFGLTPNEIIGE